VPIHVRAEPGDYAEACLLPGDPGRARYIAETYLDGAVERSSERGLLGYTGEVEGSPVSVQATGMGGPSTAIVVEELIELGVRKLFRVGTCGALRPDLSHGDLVLAISAAPADGTTRRYVDDEPHCPTADWELIHGTVHAAKELGERIEVGPVASADAFYDPDPGQHARWSKRGLLAVEMEAATLFTIAALRGVQAGCLLAVTDTVTGDTRMRISDAGLGEAVDRMAKIALKTVTGKSH
jgi:purine-nucleoside phosphorylase